MRILHITVALLLAATPALAAGKPGLWTVVTNWQFAPPIVPAAWVALARQQTIAPPRNGQPFTHHMCMTREEAAGDAPLHLNSRDFDCQNRLVGMRRGQMVMESICHGPLEGVGRYQINWRGNEHFEGSYNFTGTMRGDRARISSTFSGDWTGADCRGVRVYIAPTP